MKAAKSNEIDYCFYKEIAKQPKGEGITKCLSCGTCSSTCQVFSVNPDYNPRKLIQKAVLGLRDDVLHSEMIWICSRCNSCLEKCPKGAGSYITVSHCGGQERAEQLAAEAALEILQQQLKA